MKIYNQNFITNLSSNEHFSRVKIAMKFNFAQILKSIQFLTIQFHQHVHNSLHQLHHYLQYDYENRGHPDKK